MSAPAIPVSWGSAARFELRLRQILVRVGPLLIGLIVALPPVLLLVNSFNVAAPGREAVWGLGNWVAAFADPATLPALWNSVALGFVRTAISLPIAIGFAWLIARSDMPGRSTVELLCWVGIFLPFLWIVGALMHPTDGALAAEGGSAV